MSDETVQVSHMVPKEVKDAASDNAEYGELSEIVREAYRIVAYGESRATGRDIKLQLVHLRNKRERIENGIDELRNELMDVDERIAKLEEELAELEASEKSYEEHLDDLGKRLVHGEHLFEAHAAVQDAAEAAGKAPDLVLDDLQKRHPDIPGMAFRPAHRSSERWTGLEEGPEP